MAALRAVLAALEAADTEYVIVGSTAAAAWGVARTTRDVDLVAVLSQRDIGLFLEALDLDDVYVPDDDARCAASVGGSFNVLHPRSGGKVDVFVASSEDAFTRSRLDRRVRLPVFGLDAWVATAEDVVLAKLRCRLLYDFAGRPVFVSPSLKNNFDLEANTWLPPGYRTYEFHPDDTVTSDLHLVDDERWPRRPFGRALRSLFMGELTYEELAAIAARRGR